MNPLVLLIGVVVVYMLLLGVRRRRENIRHNLRGLILAVVVGVFVFAIAQSQGVNHDAASLWGIAAAAVVMTMQPKRSRYIPTAERRKAIARYELTGKKYSSKKHHLDHDVPFRSGGSSTADNLRVLEKRENLKKGAKPPWWDLFG